MVPTRALRRAFAAAQDADDAGEAVFGIGQELGVAALGFGALWLLNLTTSVTGLSLGLNWFNAIVIGILGVPGFGLLLLVQWVLT